MTTRKPKEITAYRHPEAHGRVHPVSGTTKTGAEFDGKGPSGFYVTVVDAGRTGFLLGPYDTHAQALDDVPTGRRLAEQANSRAVFYSYGTSKLSTSEGQELPAGVLNHLRDQEREVADDG